MAPSLNLPCASVVNRFATKQVTVEEADAVRFAKSPPRELARAFLLFSLLSLIFGLPVAMASTQEEYTLDPNPLRTADTSSPRATLQSFLNNLGEVIDDQRRGQFSVKTGRAFLRAINALDFSTTPNGDSWLVRTRRVLLLAELIGRIELPPEQEIPGEKAVADGAVTRVDDSQYDNHDCNRRRGPA